MSASGLRKKKPAAVSGIPFKRVMLKLSGEMLGGSQGYGIEGDALERIAAEIADVHDMGMEVGVVIGGGNIFRGAQAAEWGIDRSSGDYMGMLATVINGLALQGALESKHKLYTRVLTAISMQEIAEPYIRRKAIKHLEKGRICIFAGGTGNPLFTTDTAAALRAREVGSEIIIKATKVDGVYDSDPMKNPKAKKFKTLTYLDVISRKLDVMDATAITMCMEASMPILVCKMGKAGSIRKALMDTSTGTLVES